MGFVRITAAAVLIIGAGYVHGAWSGRWGPTAELADLARRIDSVPMTIGQWSATSFELPARERAMAGADACLARVYTNAARGISISVLLLGGLPGKITTHTPDICYRGNGYELTAPEPFEHASRGGGSRASFRTALAVRRGANPSVLRIYWTWRSAKGWAASDNVRWELASEPKLTKLYVVRETGGAVIEPDRDPCKDFLDVLLPELDRAVFSPAG